MPMTPRGPRLRLTVRLPYDEAKEVFRRARARNWSVSDYVAFCIAREIGVKTARERGGHHVSPYAAQNMRSEDDFEAQEAE
jgi:hypothetical protein